MNLKPLPYPYAARIPIKTQVDIPGVYLSPEEFEMRWNNGYIVVGTNECPYYNNQPVFILVDSIERYVNGAE